MASYLRERNLGIVTQISGRVPYGRRQPDFELNNGITLYGEGEWLSSYLEGYNQAIEFGDIPDASGYFVIGYPDELRHRVKQHQSGKILPEVILTNVEYRGNA